LVVLGPPTCRRCAETAPKRIKRTDDDWPPSRAHRRRRLVAPILTLIGLFGDRKGKTIGASLQFDELTSPYLRIEALRAFRATSTDATSRHDSAAGSRGAYGRTPETTNSVEGMLV
jgi:hypothetical protein